MATNMSVQVTYPESLASYGGPLIAQHFIVHARINNETQEVSGVRIEFRGKGYIQNCSMSIPSKAARALARAILSVADGDTREIKAEL